MERKGAFFVIILPLVLICSALPVQAQIPRKISHEGVLPDTVRVPDGGSVDMVFTIYDAAAHGTALWTETQDVYVEAHRYRACR